MRDERTPKDVCGEAITFNMCLGDVVVVVDIFAFTLYVESFLDDLNS